MNELNNLLYFTLLVILLYSIVTIVLLEFAFGSHDRLLHHNFSFLFIGSAFYMYDVPPRTTWNILALYSGDIKPKDNDIITVPMYSICT